MIPRNLKYVSFKSASLIKADSGLSQREPGSNVTNKFWAIVKIVIPTRSRDLNWHSRHIFK